ncbi:hypothetical protein LUZ63_011882 [Rhynchospora breviuscula]|uniref:Reverse transcriptase domain-containing protein n=1 Tax=Rhynchospora breviuscula TaxID=2022672 RepID=A0A9Q0CJM6_9POAL|nr:hypothetical protein LUZ63_011882 [Rhynchospora breviuscula]
MLISQTQSAFTPGRQISDNIIVFKEVIHTFSLTSYKSSSFCLKVDLSKAFDRMKWPFIKSVMNAFGLPSGYINWVTTCITSARYSILINGKADRFIRPTNGLKQGCALSPYIFIMALDIFSRLLQYKVSKKQLKGIKLSRGGPILTTLLYADDLLIFGEASQQEITCVHRVLNLFCNMSGQQIGSDKTRIWFSKATPPHLRQLAISAFNAQLATGSEVYLGSPISAGRTTDFSPLIDKIEGKLQNWASSMLSQAGKLTLIKSVIEPTMLFAMQSAAIPISTLKLIQSKIRAFFWGKGDQKRMPLVAWRHITVSKQQGGLGLKDMIKFQQSLSMKSRCTSLWKAIIAVKPLLKDSIRWQLGNGRSCRAVGQPWHEIWMHYSPSNANQRRWVVADLVAEDGEGWNSNKLIQLSGFHGALYIALNFPQGPKLSQRQDRLIFTGQQNGQFTIKGAYNLLVQNDRHMQNLTHLPADLYKLIWKTRDVLPRARLFLWRAVREALPVDQVLSSRMSKTPTGCLLCGDFNETVVHVLFKCPLAQQIWRLSQFDLSTTGLPDNMVHLMAFLVKELDSRQFPTFISIMWNWWKDRCKRVYEGKKSNPQQTLAAANYWTFTLEKAGLFHTKYLSHEGHHKQQFEQHFHSNFTCWIDASWTHPGIGGSGVAYILLDKEGLLVHYQLNITEATSPFHAELLSLKEAFRSVLQMGISQCAFFTDCLLLQSITSGSTKAEAADWMAFNDTMDFIADWVKQPQFYCVHVAGTNIKFIIIWFATIAHSLKQ